MSELNEEDINDINEENNENMESENEEIKNDQNLDVPEQSEGQIEDSANVDDLEAENNDYVSLNMDPIKQFDQNINETPIDEDHEIKYYDHDQQIDVKSNFDNSNDLEGKMTITPDNSITYKNLLSENKQLRSELDQKNKIIKDLKAENLNLQEAERKRNLDFQNIKREHSQLLEQIETFRNSNSASTKPAQNEAEGDGSDSNEKVSLLKK